MDERPDFNLDCERFSVEQERRQLLRHKRRDVPVYQVSREERLRMRDPTIAEMEDMRAQRELERQAQLAHNPASSPEAANARAHAAGSKRRPLVRRPGDVGTGQAIEEKVLDFQARVTSRIDARNTFHAPRREVKIKSHRLPDYKTVSSRIDSKSSHEKPQPRVQVQYAVVKKRSDVILDQKQPDPKELYRQRRELQLRMTQNALQQLRNPGSRADTHKGSKPGTALAATSSSTAAPSRQTPPRKGATPPHDNRDAGADSVHASTPSTHPSRPTHANSTRHQPDDDGAIPEQIEIPSVLDLPPVDQAFSDDADDDNNSNASSPLPSSP
ncbi:uncharacterized protein MONBRDRAFT_31618 [Monosiga brevicollis MX1]|uniref:Uncharacterized protein n=1 Tax=Monosiga brevicollis TaxID=81824 RepID=A9UUR4_MONBE|nr:uncharacterized protein MONBRDRAFT_31618 [Monosiga brevicollis MX1]EDQ90767.1 predicted protein [Monosiga brevicollis MX1]|eukprot:XP_001744064.1 hypothetical protein [Monosiga brevicollis MX1]